MVASPRKPRFGVAADGNTQLEDEPLNHDEPEIIPIEDGDEILYGIQVPVQPKKCVEDEQPVRVLTLDGGGLRGCFTVQILKELFQTNTDDEVDVSELFDLVVGTSTGGLLAAGIVNGKSLDECDDLYDTVGEEVFTDHAWISETLRSWWEWGKTLFSPASSSRYSTETMEGLIKKFLNVAESQMTTHTSRPHCCLVATRTDISLQQPYLFRTYPVQSSLDGRHYPGQALLKSPPGTHVARWWEACRATAAAPGYFQPIKVDVDEIGNVGTFEDGGIYANDPALIGCIEAHALYPDRPILVVSIGTGKMSQQDLEEPSGLVSWGSRLAGGLSDGSETLHRMCLRTFLQEGRAYFRFNENMTKTDMTDANALDYWREVGETYAQRSDVRQALANIRTELKLWGQQLVQEKSREPSKAARALSPSLYEASEEIFVHTLPARLNRIQQKKARDHHFREFLRRTNPLNL